MTSPYAAGKTSTNERTAARHQVSLRLYAGAQGTPQLTTWGTTGALGRAAIKGGHGFLGSHAEEVALDSWASWPGAHVPGAARAGRSTLPPPSAPSIGCPAKGQSSYWPRATSSPPVTPERRPAGDGLAAGLQRSVWSGPAAALRRVGAEPEPGRGRGAGRDSARADCAGAVGETAAPGSPRGLPTPRPAQRPPGGLAPARRPREAEGDDVI